MLEEIPKRDRRDYVLPEFAALYLKNTSEMSKRVHKHFEACGVRTQKPGTGYIVKKDTKGRERRVYSGKRAVVEVGFHSLRHTFVSLCREANAPLAVVEAIVGHANPAMTRHYTHIGEAAATTAVAALPDITGNGKPALAEGATVTVPVATLRELAEQLSSETAVEVRAQLCELIGSVQSG
jgi:integrase